MITSFDPDSQKDIKATPKRKAQELLLRGMQISFVSHMDGHTTHGMTQREKDLIWEQMDKQMSRVEKLFGFEPGSW